MPTMICDATNGCEQIVNYHNNTTESVDIGGDPW